jgi:hypothetical protein
LIYHYSFKVDDEEDPDLVNSLNNIQKLVRSFTIRRALKQYFNNKGQSIAGINPAIDYQNIEKPVIVLSMNDSPKQNKKELTDQEILSALDSMF